jgi:SynChlorMet cassette protein ScmD
MHETDIFLANPSLQIRDDFDDFAILFDPHSGKAFGLNPVGELIWKSLKDETSLGDIILQVKANCRNITESAEREICAFVDQLEKNGLIGRRV